MFKFLSTPPSRVATWFHSSWCKLLLCVSIHATLAGGDFITERRCIKMSVSIHATLAGGDGDDHDIEKREQNVSIHATLAGGDHQS